MANIEGQEPQKEQLVILPLQTTFSRSMTVIGSGITDIHISALEGENEEQIKEVRVKVKDEILSQLSVYTVNDVPAKAFVKKLAKRETYHNWKMKPTLMVFKKYFFSCLTIFAKVFCLVLMFYLFPGCLVVLCCFYLFLVLMAIWFIMPQDLLCQMSIFFYEIIHFRMSKMCLCFLSFMQKTHLHEHTLHFQES